MLLRIELKNDKQIATDLTLAIITGLEPDVFRNKQTHLYLLIAKFFIWFCRTQDKAPKLENFSTFLTSFSES